jgi:acyl-ACP thioesterase
MDFQKKKAENLKTIWEEEFIIHAKDIDINGKLKFYCICGYFFEMAARHANHLRFGFKDLKQENVYWVLSRLHVKVITYPDFDQKIKIETWHKGVDRLFGLRDFRMYCNGTEMALATTAWLILDKKTGRPVRPDKFTELHHSKTAFSAINEIPDKLGSLAESDNIKWIQPGYTDLDINVHVNAGKYITWIQDLYSPDFYKKNQVADFQINYLNETRYGEKVRILWKDVFAENQLNSLIEGRIDETDDPAFRARINWGTKDKN